MPPGRASRIAISVRVFVSSLAFRVENAAVAHSLASEPHFPDMSNPHVSGPGDRDPALGRQRADTHENRPEPDLGAPQRPRASERFEPLSSRERSGNRSRLSTFGDRIVEPVMPRGGPGSYAVSGIVVAARCYQAIKVAVPDWSASAMEGGRMYVVAPGISGLGFDERKLRSLAEPAREELDVGLPMDVLLRHRDLKNNIGLAERRVVRRSTRVGLFDDLHTAKDRSSIRDAAADLEWMLRPNGPLGDVPEFGLSSFAEGLDRIESELSDDRICRIVEHGGPPDPEERRLWIEVLVARKHSLLTSRIRSAAREKTVDGRAVIRLVRARYPDAPRSSAESLLSGFQALVDLGGRARRGPFSIRVPEAPTYIKRGRAQQEHPQPNENGNPVILLHPSPATPPSTRVNPEAIATYLPQAGRAHPPEAFAWTDIEGLDPPDSAGVCSAGVVLTTPDGRFVLITPSNGFGRLWYTFPKGRVEPGMSFQQTAVMEAGEETGYRCQLTGWLGDFSLVDDYEPGARNGFDRLLARFYRGEIICEQPGAGCPPGVIGWESQAIHHVPESLLSVLLINEARDLAIVQKLRTDNAPAAQRGVMGAIEHQSASSILTSRQRAAVERSLFDVDILDRPMLVNIMRGTVDPASAREWLNEYYPDVVALGGR